MKKEMDMKKWIVLLIVCLGLNVHLQAQGIRQVNKLWIEQMQKHQSDTIYVVNFWATWCKPCVAELPLFDSLQRLPHHPPIKVILVSNDMRKELNTRLPEFIKQRNVKSTVYWMSEMDANNWINLVNPDWSGAIPATWIICPSKKINQFKEGEIDWNELNTLIKTK